MKPIFLVVFLTFMPLCRADSLPVFTLQPTNQLVTPGSTVTFNALATGATCYQWRFNGADILGATNAVLQILNAQTTNSGYYNVIAQSSVGRVPSQLTYIDVVGTSGFVPLSNLANNYFEGQAIGLFDGQPISGYAQVVAGPELDEMQLFSSGSSTAIVTNGYYQLGSRFFPQPVPVSNVVPGQNVYYCVNITYTNGGNVYTQQSSVMDLIAGANGSAPSVYGLLFPAYPEWPDPILMGMPYTNEICVSGETVAFTNEYWDGAGPGQWRKDGNPIPLATNVDIVDGISDTYNVESYLVMTNIQACDAGVYDCVIYGDDWVISPRIYLSVQTTNGPGVFQNASFNGANFICTILGAPGRNYDIQWSTNLLNWYDLTTVSNVTGSITFTNASGPVSQQFYRTVLLPYPYPQPYPYSF